MLRDPSLIPLSHQHHNALAMCVLVRRSLAGDSSAGNVALQARRILDRFELEILNHFELEEQLLFPACRPLPLIDELVADHRALEALARELRSEPTAALLEQFCARISSHIRREESDLFEQAQRALPRDLLDRLGREIDQRAVRICL